MGGVAELGTLRHNACLPAVAGLACAESVGLFVSLTSNTRSNSTSSKASISYSDTDMTTKPEGKERPLHSLTAPSSLRLSRSISRSHLPCGSAEYRRKERPSPSHIAPSYSIRGRCVSWSRLPRHPAEILGKERPSVDESFFPISYQEGAVHRYNLLLFVGFNRQRTRESDYILSRYIVNHRITLD
jgi:hypothetical protein